MLGEWWDLGLILMGEALASYFTLIIAVGTLCFIITGEWSEIYAGMLMMPTVISNDANVCAHAAVIIVCEEILTYQKLKHIKTISKK